MRYPDAYRLKRIRIRPNDTDPYGPGSETLLLMIFMYFKFAPCPLVMSHSLKYMSISGKLRQGARLESSAGVETLVTSSAMNMFRNKDRIGQELQDAKLASTHQNQVCLRKSSWYSLLSSFQTCEVQGSWS